MKSRGSSAPARSGARSIREKAYLLIQQKIAQGELPPGGAVSEIPIAQELGSSRTPVREALGQLAAEGLLEQTPNRGMIVVQFGRQDIIDLYELREALEVYAVGKAARQRNSLQEHKRLQAFALEILALKKELEEGPGTQLDEKQMRRFIACDLGFHTLLLRLAANVRIQKMVTETRLLVRIFSIHRTGHDATALERIHGYHQGILEAVMKQDQAKATSLMARHIQESQQERLSEFDRWEHEASIRKTLPVLFDVPEYR
ncbi:MAG TPA: GntR family transcriptional regulator [Bryobacteraceae bacterium]|nr:GntR family transcriptional regulator [Bryobacteraceae bacterium]